MQELLPAVVFAMNVPASTLDQMSRATAIQVEVTRFVDSGQPGFVELAFTDAVGRSHRFVEKIPVVTAHHLDETSTYPQPATIACVIVAHGVDAAGSSIVTVDTSRPWDIASTSGESTFVVRPEQLEGVANGSERDLRLVVEQNVQLRSEHAPVRTHGAEFKVHFDGARIKGWDTFHDQSAAVFGFPDFYGRNLNAWIDCLTYVREGDGMSRFRLGPEAPLVIEVTNSQAFRKSVPEIFAAFVDCVAFVNQRQNEAGEKPAVQLLLL